MQKNLARREEGVIVSFEDKYAGIISVDDDDFVSIGCWRAALEVMARCTIELIKHDMCSNSSSLKLEIADTVASSFQHANPSALYSDDVLSSLYYIAGWYITACLKAGRIRAGKRNDGDIGKVMISLFECGSIEQKDTNNIPTEKVVRSEIFGGLKFISAVYFDFILKLEYVFVRCLTSTKLAVLGNSLVQRLYRDLCGNIDHRRCVLNIMSDVIVKDDALDDLVLYLVRTYCQMRGKDFCRNLMATNFNNLG